MLHEDFQRLSAEHLHDVFTSLEKHGLKPFLVYGTVLHVVRDGLTTRTADTDMDIGLMTDELTPDILAELKQEHNIKILCRRWKWTRMCFKRPGSVHNVDFFTFHKHTNGNVYCWLQGNAYQRLPDVFGDCSSYVHFGGYDFRVPNSTVRYLDLLYGDDWRIEKLKIDDWWKKHKVWMPKWAISGLRKEIEK